MKQLFKLPAVTLAAALLSAGSVYALERAAPQQLAQAGPDEEGGPPAEKAPPKAEPKEPRGGGGGGEEGPPARARDGGDGPPAARQRGGDGDGPPAARQRGGDGDGDAAPRRQREKAGDGDAPSERPARPAREKDAEPRERKEPAPAANDDEPPAVKKKAEPDEPKAPPPKKEPPAEKKAPEPKDEPAPKQVEPKEKAPAEKSPEPAQRKKADPAPDADMKDQPPKSDAKEPPPAAVAPKEAPKEGPPKEGPPKDGVPGKEGLPGKEGRAAEPAPAAAGAVAAPEVKDLKELKQERKERSEDGGKRIVIEEPDKRTIVKEGGQTIIRHDETERFRRLGGNVRREKRNGLDISINISPGGIEIYTESDDRGRPLRRYRRDRDGREVILFDNRDYYRRHRDGSFVDAIVDLPPPRVRIPREDYVVDYEEASDVDVYEALSAPPVEELDRTYSLEEVRRSPNLRDRMRRVDLDAINFAFGAFDVGPDQYPALERIAKAMKRVVERNPNEMFMIEGHTDAVGSDEDNLSLSDRRAESVSIILTEEFGVPPENMTTQGYGEQYLKVNTEAAERQNRRVAVRRITPLLSRGN